MQIPCRRGRAEGSSIQCLWVVGPKGAGLEEECQLLNRVKHIPWINGTDEKTGSAGMCDDTPTIWWNADPN